MNFVFTSATLTWYKFSYLLQIYGNDVEIRTGLKCDLQIKYLCMLMFTHTVRERETKPNTTVRTK